MAESPTATVTTHFVVDPKIAGIIPPLRADERQLLEESLVRDGCREPLVVWGNTLLDGHNRYEICTRLGLPFETQQMSFPTSEKAKVWAIENQLARRNLSDIDRIALAAQREPLIKATVAKNKGKRTDLPQNSAEGPSPAETRQVAAQVAGVSHDTYTKGKRILERGAPELVQAVRDKATSINTAAEIAELPIERQRDVIAKGDLKDEARKVRDRRSQGTGSDEWYTPDHTLDAVRKVIPVIDLDPASNALAQKRVKAGKYYDKTLNGLTQTWEGRVWLNPPYSRKLIGPFVEKLLAELAAGNVVEAILLTNNETDTQWFQIATARADRICLHRGRIRFKHTTGKGGAPQQGQIVFYFGRNAARFTEVFGELGTVVRTVGSGDAVPTSGES